MASGLLDIGRFLKGRAARIALAVLAVVAAVVASLALAGYWLLATPGGAEWALRRAGADRVEGLRGRLLGPLAVGSLRLAVGDRIVAVEALELDWRPAALRERRLEIRRLAAARVDVASPHSDAAAEMPDTLRLPLAVVVAELRIGELRLLAAEDGRVRLAVRAIEARGDSDGQRHRVHALRFAHEYGDVTGQGEIAAERPFESRAEARFEARGGSAAPEPPVLEAQAAGNLESLSVRATGRGAGLRGSAEAALRPFAPNPLAGLRLALAEFDPQALSPRLPHARLSADADLQARADGRMAGPLRLRNAAPAALDRGGVPVQAIAALADIGADGRMAFDDLDAALAGGGRITGRATWTRADASGTADLSVQGLDLAALDTRLRATRLAGSASLSGGAQAQRGRLTLADGALRIEAEGARAGEELTLERALVRLGRNRLDAEGRFGGRDIRLHARVEAPELGDVGPGFGGSLSARVELAGRLARPDARFSVQGKSLLLLASHRIAALDAEGESRGDALRFALELAGYAGAEGETRISRLTATVEGRDVAHGLRIDAALAGDRRLALRARGALSGSYERWRGRIEALDAALPVPVRLLSPAPLSIAWEKVEIGAATLEAGGGRIEHGASVWTPQRWSSRGRFTGVGLRLVGAALTPGGESLRLGGGWDAAATGARVDGRIEVARESGDWIIAGESPLALGISDLRLNAAARGDRIDVSLAAAGARLGNWRGAIGLTLPASRGALELPPATRLDGRVGVALGDVAWLGALLGDEYSAAGRLELDLALGGTLGTPDLRGRAHGRELTLALHELGVRFERGELDAAFDADRLRVERLRASAPHAPPAGVVPPFAARAGTIEGRGEIDLQARRGRLDFEAGRLPLVQRTDRWIVASGRAGVELEDSRLGVTADLVADVGHIAEPPASRPQLSPDVVVAGRRRPAAGARVDVAADFDLGRNFRLRAAGLDARLDGALHVAGERGRPLRARGSIAAVDATFAAYGQTLTVERGIVNFQGALDDPGLNVLALRKGLEVEAGVEVAGTVKAPRVRLVSTPPVPDPEKLSWIVLGRAPEAAGADSGLLLAAAGALLGGRSGGGPTGQLAQAFGVDELSLRSEPGAADLTSQIVSVGKRLSSRATIGYEQGLSAAAGVMKLTWQLTPRIAVVTRAGADNAIDLTYTFAFD